MKEFAALLGALLSIGGNVPYLRQIGKGVEPHPYTWGFDALVSGIVLAGIVVKGAGVGAWPVAMSFAFSTVIFIYSLRYGRHHVTRADTILIVVALVGLVPWYFSSDPTISIAVAVALDLISFIPTIRKTYLHPYTEASVLYATNAVRHTLVLVALESYSVATTLHSSAMIVLNIGMVLLIFARRRT